jgi:uncharacterized protein DUF6328
MNELLQELRVAQTGVQILFAFLLTLVFQPRFADITESQRWTYVATLLLSVVTAGLLVAPAAVHRTTFQRGLKMETVLLGRRLFTGGLAMLAVTVAGGVLLVLDVTVGSWVRGPGGPRVPAPVAFAVVLVAVAAAAAPARPQPTRSRAGGWPVKAARRPPTDLGRSVAPSPTKLSPCRCRLRKSWRTGADRSGPTADAYPRRDATVGHRGIQVILMRSMPRRQRTPSSINSTPCVTA